MGNKKRVNFIKGLSASLAVAAGVTGATAIANERDNLSKYNKDNDKIIEYVDSNDKGVIEMLETMDENVEIYKQLNGKVGLSDEDTKRLESAKDAIREVIISDKLSEFYLEDVFKEKVKSIYSAEHLKVNYVDKDDYEFMSIDVYNKKPKSKLDKPSVVIEKNDMPNEMKSAIRGIVNFQEYATCTRDEIGDKSISNAIKYYESMKGFANIDLIRTSDNRIAIMETEQER